jgi:membrane protein implicated in regulation of membrane protease activity
MAIDVLCDCGKRLKAPDWMAGRSTQCPACWAPVTVPKPRWFGIFGASSRSKRRRKRAESRDRNSRPVEAAPRADFSPPAGSASAAAPPPASGNSIVLPQRRSAAVPTNRKTTFVPSRQVTDGDDYRPNSVMLRSQPRWVKLLPDSRKQRWYSSLVFPFSQLPVFIRLGLLQAVLTTAALIFWLSLERDNPAREQMILWMIACLGCVFFVMGHTFHYFNAILEMASHGQTKHEPGIGCTALGALVSCGHWLSCFVAGPALLFAAAVGYWLYCGDLTVVDWSILAELCFAGVAWWLIALLLTNIDDTLRVASPVQVLRTAFSMPGEGAALTILAAAILLAHFFAAAYAIGQLHVTPLTAFPLLWACWSSGFYLTAYVFRRLGLTYYRAQRRISDRKQSRVRSAVSKGHQGAIPEDSVIEPSTLVQQHLSRDSK